MNTRPPANSADHEIVSTRLFPASGAKIFAAHADPAALAAWWGPKGFTNEFHAFEFRAGGAWRFTMRGPDGATYVQDKLFTEIVAPERIVVRHAQQGHGFLMTMTFAERAGGTEVIWRMRFDDPAEAERLRSFIAAANEENFDRLAAHLAGAA
jgi:uncharacterized protein YndB with AHSA1/START domain